MLGALGLGGILVPFFPRLLQLSVFSCGPRQGLPEHSLSLMVKIIIADLPAMHGSLNSPVTHC